MTEKDQEDLSAYLDDALSPAEKTRVETALAARPELARALAQLRRLKSALKELTPVPMPADFADKVRRRAEPKPRGVWFYIPTFVAAAAVALVMVRITREEKALDAVYKASELPAAAPMVAPSKNRLELNEKPRENAAPARQELRARIGEESLGKIAATEGLADRRVFQDQEAVETEKPAFKEKKDASPLERDADEFVRGDGGQTFSPAPAAPAGPKTAKQEKSPLSGIAEVQSAAGLAGAVGGDKSAGARRGAVGAARALSAPSGRQRRWAGDQRGFSDARQVVVRSDKVWAALWSEINGGITPPPPVPPVNFETDMVVGVFLEAKPSGGYGVELRAERAGAELRAIYAETVPDTGMTQITVITMPYALLSVPRFDGPVRFLKE